jgi:tagaturonate epimerase
MLSTIGLSPSFGFGDRLGSATPGHIAAVRGTRFVPVFAQQSVRENARTGRTPQQVMDDARRAVDAAGWDTVWGADADHLKTVDDLLPFVSAGYTFYTIDPGAFVVNEADKIDPARLHEMVDERINWEELSNLYLHQKVISGLPAFDDENLLRAVVKYGRAILHTISMFRRLKELRAAFDFEVSVDETDSPTTPLEHFFIVNELTRQEVTFTSLAPRFIGRFEKGVDYIGDLKALDVELAKHAEVTSHFGSYKISLHSGSDKFSVYPLLVKHWADRIHVKTAGTSYLEALRTLAATEPELFQLIWHLGLERYPTDRATYHVSADPAQVRLIKNPIDFLDDFHAREILHVTFGSAMAEFGDEIRMALTRHNNAYQNNLQSHFLKHLELLT